MKYIVTITETKNGIIEISDESRKKAEEKALTISMNNPERFHWEESKYCIMDVKNKLMICNNCNAEIPSDSEYCNKCGKKVIPEHEIDLGRVYSSVLNASCQTKTLFRKLHRENTEDQYDTLLLHTRFSILSENGKYYPSFYVRKVPLNCTTKNIYTGFTITDIKNKFSPGREMRTVNESFYAERLEQIKETGWERHKWQVTIDMLICNAFCKMQECDNSEVFFETPISFMAQKSDPNEIGRMSTYYIVGINFKKTTDIN